MTEDFHPTQASVAEALANARRLVATHPTQAAAQAKEIIRSEPGIAEPYIILSFALRALAEMDEAKAAEIEGIDRAERDPVIQRVTSLLSAQDFTKAESLIDRYILDTPNDPVALRLRARLYQAIGQSTEANALLRRSLALAPHYEAAIKDLEDLQGELHSIAGSEQWFTPQPSAAGSEPNDDDADEDAKGRQ